MVLHFGHCQSFAPRGIFLSVLPIVHHRHNYDAVITLRSKSLAGIDRNPRQFTLGRARV